MRARRAGAEWFYAEVVIDANLMTSRRPADLPAFIDNVVEVFARSAAARPSP